MQNAWDYGKILMPKLSRLWAVVIVVIVVVAVAGGGAYYYLSSVSAPSQTKPIIRVGTTFGIADSSDVPAMYALTVVLPTLGYTANVNVFTGQTATSAALLSGEIDVVHSSPAAFVALSLKTNGGIVAFGNAESANDAIMVCTANVTSWNQIISTHTVVAVTSFTDSSYYFPYVWLKNNGYNPDAVNWQFVPGAGARGAALLSGKIPCGSTDVGSTIKLLQTPGNKWHVLADLASMIPGFPLSVLFTTRDYFNTHRDAIVAVDKAYTLAARWADNKQNWLSFAPSIMGSQIDLSYYSQVYDTQISLGEWYPNGPWNSTIGTTIANVLYQFKLAGITTFPDPSTWADFTVHAQVLSDIGLWTGTWNGPSGYAISGGILTAMPGIVVTWSQRKSLL
jgi:hypothetical protein